MQDFEELNVLCEQFSCHGVLIGKVILKMISYVSDN